MLISSLADQLVPGVNIFSYEEEAAGMHLCSYLLAAFPGKSFLDCLAEALATPRKRISVAEPHLCRILIADKQDHLILYNDGLRRL
jgi:hypothetical protein